MSYQLPRLARTNLGISSSQMSSTWRSVPSKLRNHIVVLGTVIIPCTLNVRNCIVAICC